MPIPEAFRSPREPKIMEQTRFYPPIKAAVRLLQHFLNHHITANWTARIKGKLKIGEQTQFLPSRWRIYCSPITKWVRFQQLDSRSSWE
jgi:hypothetical protein